MPLKRICKNLRRSKKKIFNTITKSISVIYTKTETTEIIVQLEGDTNFTASLDRLMMIRTAKTLLLGVIAFVRHKFVDAFKRLDKKAYFQALKQFCAEEKNELAWLRHFLHQHFYLGAKKALKIIKLAIEDVSCFVRLLTSNGVAELHHNFSGETSFPWLTIRGAI